MLPEARPKDGHDVVSTFGLPSDFDGMRRSSDPFDAFVTRLRGNYASLMSGRPEVGSGAFKVGTTRMAEVKT